MKKQNEKGSFTIEAILSLSIFMFAFVAIISLATVAKIESTTQYAIDQTAKEISRYCYIADRAATAAGLNPNVTPDSNEKIANVDGAIQSVFDFADAFSNTSPGKVTNTNEQLSSMLSNIDANDFESITNAAQNVYSSFGPIMNDPKGAISALVEVVAKKGASILVSRVIAQPMCKTLVPKYITSNGDANETLEKMGVVDGLNGLNFSMSSFLMDGRSINIVVVYQIKVNGFGIFDQTIVVKQTASTAAWITGTSLSDVASSASYWDLPDLERGKKFVSELQDESPHKGVKAGQGIDLYDQDTNTFTSVHSINVYSASYSNYSKDSDPQYELKANAIKSQVKGYVNNLKKSIDKVDVNLTMEDGTTCQTAKENVTHRSAQLMVAVPSSVLDDAKAKENLNQLAVEIEAETGVKVNWTYRS